MIRGNRRSNALSTRRGAALAACALSAALALAACDGGGLPGLPTNGPQPETHSGRTFSVQVFVSGPNVRLTEAATVTVCQPPTDGAPCPQESSIVLDHFSTFKKGAAESTLLAGTEISGRWEYIQVEVDDASGKQLAMDIITASWQLTDGEDHGIGQADLRIRLE